MSKRSYAFLFCCCWLAGLLAQTNVFFSPLEPTALPNVQAGRGCETPSVFTAWHLDVAAAQAALSKAPMEFTTEALAHQCQITLPLADGTWETFGVWETAILDAELALRHPDIRTYAGRSTRHSARTLRLTLSMRGFRAMILQPDLGVHYVEPYRFDQTEFYIAYDRTTLPFGERPRLGTGFVPKEGFSDKTEPYAPPAESRGTPIAEPVSLRTLRLTVAATGEFTQDHGGTKPSALAAITEYTNMTSAFFERDADLRLQLTSCTEICIYTDPATDAFTGNTVQDWMGQNGQVVGLFCGSATHDVGHVFARYLGGSAIGVAGGIACTPSEDAGCSAGVGVGNYGDGFLNTFGQEVGHQLNGGHTWNRCDGGGGRAGNTAFEPGSGSTIMSYAGACGPDNVQGYSDLYYHSGSIDEFIFFFREAAGVGCGTNTDPGNTAPVVTLGYTNNFFIPISTPFELQGEATDADGDALSINWEEIDAGPETPLGQPQSNAAIFRTWPATEEKNRYFPRYSKVLANATDITEQLPTYTRDLTFRMLARDNRPGGGGVGWDDVAFKAWGQAGPFLVTVGNLPSTIWRVGELVNVTWDVANTDIAPVNCQKVNIRLSTDNGQTWPIMLAENVGNDGSQYVTVPANVTSNARLRIDAADNVFYDLSNSKFIIQNPTQPSLTLGLATDVAKICLPNNFSTDIISASVLGYNTPVALSIEGDLPPGATAIFGSTTLQPGQSVSLFIDLSQTTQEGTYTFNVKATPDSGTPLLRSVKLTLTSNDFTTFGLQTPNDGSTQLGLTQTLRWKKVADADHYDVQFSDSPAFTNILAQQNGTLLDSFKMTILLAKGKDYYWRVRPRNECGVFPWTEPFFFSTFAENCSAFTANDLPKNISANNANTIESKITLNAGGTISDLNIARIQGFHSYFKDLEMHLISPNGTDVLLFKDKCGNYNGGFDFGIDDSAPLVLSCPPANNGNDYRATNPLTPFVGQNSAGQWRLQVRDNVASSGGSLQDFQLEFCATALVTPPFLLNNNLMTLPSATNKAIESSLLRVDDPNTGAANLRYTLVTVPQHGSLEKNWGGPLQPGDQFTQADIDAGAIRYFDWGWQNPGEDYFRFSVTDGEGGFFGTPKFVIQPIGSSVGAGEGKTQILDFQVFPNPADQILWIGLAQKSDAELRINLFNALGQLALESHLAATSDRQSLDLSGLPKGIYFLRVEGEGVSGVRTVVVQ